ncbi:MAG: ergothioneine biosynthesis protein EgtB [Reichenbachiella sp.]
MIVTHSTDLRTQYSGVRSYSETLCSPLNIEDYVPQPEVFTSPPKWHLAHTAWFFEEMLLKNYLPDYRVFNEKYSFLFNSYYNTIGKRTARNHRGLMTRPSVEEVYQYRRYVDAHMQQLLESELSDEVHELIVLGLHHEQQHQELLLTDLKYTLSLNPLNPVYKEGFDLTNSRPEETGFVIINEGTYKIGHTGDGFCFDNELGQHTVYLHEFEISKNLVTNGEYLDFIHAGGYDNFNYWLDEGWTWVTEKKKSAPLYWEQKEDTWLNYTLSGLKPLDLKAELCHISFYEAAAFAAWKGMRLATEFEWEVASDKIPWGSRWEWTHSAYLPYPQFHISEGAVGEYNGKFMINQMVLRGGSTATSPEHSRHTYRNFFHPHAEWQYSGIRLVRV